MLQNAKSVSRDSKGSYHGSRELRATSGKEKKDPNMSGQRWNNFCTSYRDISFVVAENSRVVKPKCRQFTSLNKILNNFSKVLIVDISYTAVINNEGISGIQEAPKIIEFTFSNLLRDVRDEKKNFNDFRLSKMSIKFGANLVFALYFAYSGRFCHGWRPKANKRFRER